MKSKKIMLIIAFCLTLLLGLYGCRNSPVLQQIIYSQDYKDIDYDNDDKSINNDKDNEEEDDSLSSQRQEKDARNTNEEKTGAVSGAKDNEDSAANVKYNSDGSDKLNTGTTNNPNGTSAPSGARSDGSDEGGIGVDPPDPPGPEDTKPVKKIVDATGEEVDVPEDVDSVTAVGNAAAMVQMLGGKGRLVASSANFLENSIAQRVFSDEGIGDTAALWSEDGSTPMSDENFNRLLQIHPDVCFEISGQSTFTETQVTTMKQNGLYYVVLPGLYTTADIKSAVSIIGEVLGDKSSEEGINALSLVEDYASWFDNMINEISRRVAKYNYIDTIYGALDFNSYFGGAWYLDGTVTNAGGIKKYIDSKDNNASGKYTLFISDWDDNADYKNNSSVAQVNGKGAAVVKSGFSYSPLNYYMSLAGVLNTSAVKFQNFAPGENVYVSTSLDEISLMITGSKAVLTTGSTTYGLLRPLTEEGISSYLGEEKFPAVIVPSNAIKNKLLDNFLWKPYPSSTYTDSSGHELPFNISEGGYDVYVNPSGVDSWSEGSAESILESVWVASKFQDVYNENEVKNYVKEFYQKFYRHDLSDSEVSEILKGK